MPDRRIRFRVRLLVMLGAMVAVGWLSPPATRGDEILARRTAEARALSNQGAGAFKDGKLAEAIEHYTRALAIYRDLGLRADEAASIAAIGDVHAHMFNYEAAIPKYEEAIRLYRSLDAEVSLARVALVLGKAHMMLGRREIAIRHFEDALRVFRSVGDRARAEEAQALINRLR